jgi:hypothetical protein
MTTAVRWIAALADQGLLVRCGHTTNEGGKFVALSLAARVKMADYYLKGDFCQTQDEQGHD